MLATDGLWDNLTFDKITEIVNIHYKQYDTAAAIDELIKTATKNCRNVHCL